MPSHSLYHPPLYPNVSSGRLPSIIHTDSALASRDSQMMNSSSSTHRITLDIGNAKNKNKNPVAERAVSELPCDDPLRGPVSSLTLAIATASLDI